MKPASIATFERLYLGSIAVWVIDKALFWSGTQAAIARTPQVAANPQLAGIIGGVTVVVTLAYALVSIGLWYAVARRASVAGKWIVVVTEALGALFALGTLARLARGQVVNPTDTALALVSTVLAVAAAVFLFRRDAKAWFGEAPVDEREPLA